MDILLATKENQLFLKTWCSCFIFFVVVNNKDLASGEFSETPKNICGMVGDSNVLQCSLSENVFQIWRGPSDNDISENDEIKEIYEGKYRIVGKYNLQILNLAFGDAGAYKCVDSSDFPNPFSAEVVVTEKSNRITSNISSDLILENEVIRYTCEIRYEGNIAPSMEWTTASSDQVIIHTTDNMPGLAQTYIDIPGNVMNNGQSFTCRTFFEKPSENSENAASNTPNCTMETVSGILTVHYGPRDTTITLQNHTVLESGATIHVGDILLCKTSCNPAVTTYQWTTDVNNQQKTIGQSQSFRVQQQYTNIQSISCTVMNDMGSQGDIQGRDSVTIYLKVKDTAKPIPNDNSVTEASTGEVSGLSGGAIAGIVIGILVAVFGVALAIGLILYKRRTDRQHEQNLKPPVRKSVEPAERPKNDGATAANDYQEVSVRDTRKKRAIIRWIEEITKSHRVIRKKELELENYSKDEFPTLSGSIDLTDLGMKPRPNTSIKH